MKYYLILTKEENMINLEKKDLKNKLNHKTHLTCKILYNRYLLLIFKFNSFGFGGSRKSDNKGPDLPIKITVTLEDIYNGKEVNFFITKNIICPHCRGTGADNPDDVKTCSECNGKGFVTKK